MRQIGVIPQGNATTPVLGTGFFITPRPRIASGQSPEEVRRRRGNKSAGLLKGGNAKLFCNEKSTMADAPGMRGYRSRNNDGQLRDKRDDTHIETIEKQYGINLGVRGDMHLGTYLEEHNIASLNDLVHGERHG